MGWFQNTPLPPSSSVVSWESQRTAAGGPALVTCSQKAGRPARCCNKHLPSLRVHSDPVPVGLRLKQESADAAAASCLCKQFHRDRTAWPSTVSERPCCPFCGLAAPPVRVLGLTWRVWGPQASQRCELSDATWERTGAGSGRADPTAASAVRRLLPCAVCFARVPPLSPQCLGVRSCSLPPLFSFLLSQHTRGARPLRGGGWGLAPPSSLLTVLTASLARSAPSHRLFIGVPRTPPRGVAIRAGACSPGVCPPSRPLLRAAPESRGHVLPGDRGAVVFRPDG